MDSQPEKQLVLWLEAGGGGGGGGDCDLRTRLPLDFFSGNFSAIPNTGSRLSRAPILSIALDA